MGSDDYSFKKPGSVPFKWEIKPGVPKPQHHHHQHHDHDHDQRNFSSPTSPLRSNVFSPEDLLHSRSFRSTHSVQSDQWRLDRSNSMPLSYFLSPSLGRMHSEKMNRKPAVDEPNYRSDPLRRCLSMRSFLSRFRDSLSKSPSSMLSNQTPNRTVRKRGGWAGFGPLLLSFVTRGSD
ncbi:hypothetical protein RIF29_16735 [Crotalaria pallida]|uniref:Uncharacterized protein n=1 Tax=Crotalaria pallida TaxID=3830 RepID=A0AAN9FH23_CROPI